MVCRKRPSRAYHGPEAVAQTERTGRTGVGVGGNVRIDRNISERRCIADDVDSGRVVIRGLVLGVQPNLAMASMAPHGLDRRAPRAFSDTGVGVAGQHLTKRNILVIPGKKPRSCRFLIWSALTTRRGSPCCPDEETQIEK
jgi:hypothetical protein